MKKIVAITALIVLAGCASTEHNFKYSPETHGRAVSEMTKDISPILSGWREPATVKVRYTVSGDGDVNSFTVVGGTEEQKKRALKAINETAPFPPHTSDEPLEYKTQITFP